MTAPGRTAIATGSAAGRLPAGRSSAVTRSPAGRSPDLRLAAIAAGTWAAAAGTPHLPAAGGATVAAAALAAALLGALPWAPRPWPHPSGRPGPRRRATGRPGRPDRTPGRRGRTGSPARRVLVCLLLGVAVGSGLTAVRVQQRDAVAAAATGATVEVTATVSGDPHPLRSVRAGRPSYLVPANLSSLGGMPARARILVLASDPGWASVVPGQRLRASGRPLPPRTGDLTALVLSVGTPPTPLGRPPWVQRAAESLRAGLRRACAGLPDGAGGLLPGLVVGDTSALSPQVAEEFKATGMTHLLAVSGSNVALVLALVLLLARWCRAGPRTAAALCAVALVGFVILVRPSASVLRAAAMGAVAVVGLLSGRARSAVPALTAGIVVLLCLDPTLAVDLGFILSVAATAGLLLIAPGWRDALRRRRVPPAVAEALAVAGAAQVACAPVIAAVSGSVSLVAVPANLLAAPAVPAATVLGVAAAALSPLWPAAAALAAWLASWPARWLIEVARRGAEAPYGALPWPAGLTGALLLAVTLLLAALALRRPGPRRLAMALVAGSALGAVPVHALTSSWPPPGWRIVACDVGQGDALVLPVASGTAVVVDAGPDPPLVDNCLRSLRIRAVPLLVITHLHADHVGGLDGVLRGRRVGTVLTSPSGEPEAGRALLAARTRALGVPTSVPAPGWTATYGAVSLRLLGPLEALRGTRSDPNNNSLVLRADVAGVRILLPGDAEVEEQAAVRAGTPAELLRVDILKVAHHGSAYQDPGLLDAAGAPVALVSVGAGNDYGHPSRAVLDRLRRAGTTVLRTDQGGAVAVVWTGRGLAVVRHGHPP